MKVYVGDFMKLKECVPVICIVICLCSGCATQTTDPHQGGLFSYNPDAYKQRIQDRKRHLSNVEQQNAALQAETDRLESEKTAQTRELAALKKEMSSLSASTASLEKKVRTVRAETSAQKRERERILSEISKVQSSLKKADDIPDPEEQRLEIERLKKKRDLLEKEVSDLMLL